MKKGHFILFIILFLISVTSAFYFFDIIDFPGLKLLPYYAGSSLLRMGFAYFFAPVLPSLTAILLQQIRMQEK